MAYIESPFGQAAYGADTLTSAEPPGQVIPPPIPGGTTAYYYGSENGQYPFAWGGYSGARPQILNVSGGIVVVPHKESGTVELLGWWPNATFLHFTRIHGDGSRFPVRGGYGVPVTTMPRRNSVTNPSLEVGTNGYVPGLGNPTLTRISAPATLPTVPDGTWALRAVVASAGQLGVTAPTTYEPGSGEATAGASLYFVTRPTAVRFEIGWTDSVGGALTQTTVTFSADEINECVGQWGRLWETFAPPAGAVTPTFKIVADGMPAGGTMYADALVLDNTATDGSYIDGDSLGGTWIGAADLSASLLSYVAQVFDPDCPLDVAVTYSVADPALTGGWARSSPVTLESVGRFCWITHPKHALPVRCDLRSVPVLKRDITQGVYYPIGRSRAVVVTSRRRAPTADITFNANSYSERDALLDLFDDGAPVLLRAPAAYGYGEGRWWSFGEITEDREERLAYHDAMILTAAGTEVDAPSPLFAAEMD